MTTLLFLFFSARFLFFLSQQENVSDIYIVSRLSFELNRKEEEEEKTKRQKERERERERAQFDCHCE